MTERIIVGITGASGAAYGIALLRLLARTSVETHLVVTEAGAEVLLTETGSSVADVARLASHVHDVEQLAAPIASGSFRAAGMVVAPCTIRTLSAVACCRSSNLLERAADVTLKERRPLLLLVRETPLHAGHLRLMQEATMAGATIMPPVPAFYAGLRSLDDLVEQTAARALDVLGLDTEKLRRWE
jgi:4-hydroxy-3-polyprenylbenzoate decarboxylase